MTTQERIFGLDLFRAIAILCVVTVHGGFIINEAIPGFPGFSVPDGVELFFVLSGFLIGGMLIRLKESSKMESIPQLFSFWKRRWFRTLPAYYLVLMLNIAFAYWGLNNAKFENFNWKFVFFCQNLASPFTDFFWESWSLSIEEWFYLVTPLLIFTASYILGKKLKTKHLTLAIIALLLIFPLIYRYSISYITLDAFWFDVTFRKTVATRLDAIMYGVLMAWLCFYYEKSIQKWRWPFFLIGVLIFILTKQVISEDPTGFDAMTWHFSAMGLGASLMLPLAASWKACDNLFGKAITHLSVISYSMYLLNLGLVAMVLEKHFMPQNPLQSVTIYISFWVIVITASTLLYRHFEKPMTDLRDRF
ncbi:MAG: acyltransferase family protein [Bacteroidota bacterium]